MNILHERTSQDLHVKLVWDPATNRVYVTVRDRNTGERFLVAPANADALDAFYHPYCYEPAPEAEAELAA